jgi:tetratricopeptide (TPR) repeat protein
MGRIKEILSELRRRRVFRALLAWGIFAFAVLQVIDPVLRALDAKDWVLKAVVATLAAGFPVTVVLSWLYDLTAKGIERTPPAETRLGETLEVHAEPSAGTGEDDRSGPAGAGQARGWSLSRVLEELARAPGETLVAAWKEEPRPGERVGRFEIRRELGRGGFGVVFEAQDSELGRLVALKALRPHLPGRRRTDEWLRTEAEAVAKLEHPCIVTLFDVGTSERGPYLVMELLRGQTLAQRLVAGPLPPEEALRVARQMARGLAHAHGRGILHRDLKPANVFLCDDGRVKLLDFGLAHLLGSQGSGGSGTPGYMPPEQERGDEIDARADVYAAGMTLREMLTGQRGPAANASVPRALARPLERALAAEPGDRPRDGAAWLQEIVVAQAATERPRRLRRVAAIAAAGALAGLAVAGVAVWRGSRLPSMLDADGRVPVAVADFANLTGDPALDGLSGLLITALEQSRALRVLTRGRMWDHVRALGKGDVAQIDEALAREVGLRAGTRALLLATVRKLDDLYVVEMRAFDPQRDEYLFTAREEATGKREVLGLIDRLSDRTRAALRDPSARGEGARFPVADSSTGSLEAYGHYFRATQLEERSLYDEALIEYAKAVSIDPGFAMAHLRRARLGEFTLMDEAERATHLDAAVANISRAGPKERVLIEAWKAHASGRNEEALRLYDEAIRAWPEEKEFVYSAGDLHYHAIHRAKGDPAAACTNALPYFEAALRLDRNWEPALIHQIPCLRDVGRVDESVAATRQWIERSPTATAFRFRAYDLMREGRLDEAMVAARRAAEMKPHPWNRDPVVRILMRRKRFAEVEALLRPLATGPGLTDPGESQFLFLALLLQGKGTEALAVVDAARPAYPKLMANQRFLAQLCAGRLPEARRDLDSGAPGWGAAGTADEKVRTVVATLERKAALISFGTTLVSEMTRVRRLDAPDDETYRATAAWKAGRLEEALAILGDGRDANGKVNALRTYLIGEVELARGNPAAAVAAMESFQGSEAQVEATYCVLWPRSFLVAARSLEALGRRDEARAKVQALLDTWASADPGQPMLDEARALRARLAK